MKVLAVAVTVIAIVPVLTAGAQAPSTPPLRLPSLPGYHTLKGDFHLHTVFSDGQVWPSFRVTEAVRDGLDFIAITDHIDYQGAPNQAERDYNKPHDIAVAAVGRSKLIVLKGAEISPRTPPYHANAIFLQDVNALPIDYMADTKGRFVMKPSPTKEEMFGPFVEAKRQGAFIVYNHPAYFYDWVRKNLGPDLFTPLHRELLAGGMLHGIEVVNGDQYYVKAHRIAMEQNLTLIGGSDEHTDIAGAYVNRHRPMTLVFSRDSTAAGIKEALFARRTIVYQGDHLIGRKAELEPFFKAALEVTVDTARRYHEPIAEVRIRNLSSIPFSLKVGGRYDLDNLPGRRTILAPGGTTTVAIRTLWEYPEKIDFELEVENLLAGPDETLKTSFEVKPPWNR